jgi:ABC-type glycerol-3-phosphate transport system permease component
MSTAEVERGTYAPARSEVIATRSRRAARPRHWLDRALLYCVLAVTAFLCVVPFFFMFSGSLMAPGEIFSLTPHFWPDKLVWENYRDLFQRFAFLLYLRNSVVISVAQTMGVLFFCSLAGFVFAKRRFPGRDWLFVCVLVAAILPNGQTTIIPFYLLMVQLDWINTFWPLIIPWWAPPLSIFLMRQYIAAGIPDDLIDAATIDGSGLFGTYWRIVVPLSAHGLVVIGILQFVAVWNDFLYGLLVLKRDDLRTVTVALTELSRRTQQATLYGPLFAGIVLATLPTILIFIVFQRRLTQGILSGAIRG